MPFGSPRFGTYKGMWNPSPQGRPGFRLLRNFNAIMAQHGAYLGHKLDTEDPKGYAVTVHYVHKGVPKISPDDYKTVADTVQQFQGAVHKRYAQVQKYHDDNNTGVKLPQPPTVGLEHIKLEPGKGVRIPGIQSDAQMTTKMGTDPAYVNFRDKNLLRVVDDARKGHEVLAAHHKALGDLAGMYGGTVTNHASIPDGYTQDPSYLSRPHVKPGGVHASTFHFKDQAAAWRAMTSIKASDPQVYDVAAHDSKGKEVLNLLTQPTDKKFESADRDVHNGTKRFDVEKKESIGEFDGLPVFIVEGGEVRSHLVDFACGGNPLAYPRMPKEIWIERLADPLDQAMTLVHELTEYVAMKYGKKAYLAAHHLANSAEALVRQVAGQPTEVSESAKGGALRDSLGRYSSLFKEGGAEWVPDLPRRFCEMVEKLGGKVKRAGRGGGMACLFKTHEAAKVAQAKLSEQGHRVSQHDLPGILLVSFVADREPPVQERATSIEFDGVATPLLEAKLPRRLDGNPNQRDALDVAKQLGAEISNVHRTGEISVKHASWPNGVTINSRRKDTPRELVKRLNQLLSIREDSQDDADTLAIDKHLKTLKKRGHGDLVDQYLKANYRKNRKDIRAAVAVPVVDPKDPSGKAKAFARHPSDKSESIIAALESALGEDRDGFHRVVDDQATAEKVGQEMADKLGCEVAIVKSMADGDGDEAEGFLVLPADQWEDSDEEDPDDYVMVAVLSPSGVEEAVAQRHGLAARLSAGRIRGRPLGGTRLRVARTAKAWRRAHPGRTKRKRMHTVYRQSSSLHPLKKHL